MCIAVNAAAQAECPSESRHGGAAAAAAKVRFRPGCDQDGR